MTKLPGINETQWEAQVRHLAKIYHWTYYHTWLSKYSAAGFPDCVLVSAERHRIIFAELKSETGQLSPEQYEWLTELTEAGCKEVYLWRPSDFDKIAQILSGK